MTRASGRFGAFVTACLVVASCNSGSFEPSEPEALDVSVEPIAAVDVDPGDWTSRGPGLGVPPESAPLLEPCAYLVGGPTDADHHNLVVVDDGYAVMPWAPESGGGGITLFDVSAPCAPRAVGTATDPTVRESHVIATSPRVTHRSLPPEGRFVAVGAVDGVTIWDVTAPARPEVASHLELPGQQYPDAYARVVFSITWIGRFLYVSAMDNGLFIVDVTDPFSPELLDRRTFEPPLRLATVHLLGDVAVAATSEGSRALLLDVRDPLDPVPIPGGDIEVLDSAGNPADYYAANLYGKYLLFARKQDGGGVLAYDISDVLAPELVFEGFHPEGSGGYVSRQGDLLAVGNSAFANGFVLDPGSGAPAEPTLTVHLEGDNDTIMPLGAVLVVSVDEDAEPGRGSAVYPWTRHLDVAPPVLELHRPTDGGRVGASTVIGLSFDELIEGASVHPGSFRVIDSEGFVVPGWYTVQEAIVNFAPAVPWVAGGEYVVEVQGGGIVDLSGNAVEETTRFRFTVDEHDR